MERPVVMEILEDSESPPPSPRFSPASSPRRHASPTRTQTSKEGNSLFYPSYPFVASIHLNHFAVFLSSLLTVVARGSNGSSGRRRAARARPGMQVRLCLPLSLSVFFSSLFLSNGREYQKSFLPFLSKQDRVAKDERIMMMSPRMMRELAPLLLPLLTSLPTRAILPVIRDHYPPLSLMHSSLLASLSPLLSFLLLVHRTL